MQIILDDNVIISAMISKEGSPAKIMREWLRGSFEIIISQKLLEELGRVLTYPKLQKYTTQSDIDNIINLLSEEGVSIEDAELPSEIFSKDPDDNYLIALALRTKSMIVTGDLDLLSLSNKIPIFSPVDFLEKILEPSD